MLRLHGRLKASRRPLRRALALGILALLPATALTVPASASTAVTITPLSATTAAGFALTDKSYVSATNNLWTNLLTHATLPQVVGTNITTNSAGATDSWLNLRTMRACAGAGPESRAVPPSTVTKKVAKCWSSAHGDDTTQHWYPQGLSTTGTADGGDGAIQGLHVIAISWHYKTLPGETSSGCKTNNLLKLTLIDRDTWQYRHVLLVEPTSTSSTASNFTYVTGHGGGIAWYGNYIFVTDSDHGLRVFDLNRLAKADTYGSAVNTVGMSGGKASACGYPYLLPEVHTYTQAGAPNCGAGGSPVAGALCFSWLSLDKTGGGSTYRLVAGEWYDQAPNARLVRYQLNTASAASAPGLLTTSGGKTVGMEAYSTSNFLGLQGGMTWTDSAGALNFAFQKGCRTKPGVFSHVKLNVATTTTTCADGGNWASGPPQALSYWPVLGTTTVNELWGQTEGLCLSPSDPNYVAPTETTDACWGYSATTTAPVRAVFAVGFTDPAVQSRT